MSATTDTMADRIEQWHRMRPPANVAEHVLAAELLGIASPRLERKIRAYWSASAGPKEMGSRDPIIAQPGWLERNARRTEYAP